MSQQTEYRNSVPAFHKLDNSLGEIVVIDALSGYGKTAFLQEAARRRKTQNWQAEYIPLSRMMGPADVWTTTVHELSGDRNLKPQKLEDALSHLSYSLQQGTRLAILFDDVHSLQHETLSWVQAEFAPKLKEELFNISQGNCLIVFSGQNIPGSPTAWPNHRRIYLLPFDRNTIQQFVDAVPSPELQRFLQSVRNKRWLIEKMMRLCGGHPRALLQILQAIESGNWRPHPRQSDEYDRAIFEQHIETEINRLTGNLSDCYRQMLEGLSIFRSVNSSIVKLIQQHERIGNQDNPLAIVSHLRTNNLLIAKETVLDPVIRNGLTTRLMFKDRQRYLRLNQIAQQAYENWLRRFDQERPFEEARSYAAEAIYHCLCHSDESPVFQNCLSTVIQQLDQLLAVQDAPEFNSAQMLTEHLSYDEDISTMLSDYGWSIEQQILEMQNSPQQTIAQPDVVPCDYADNPVSILDANKTAIGTGFLVQHQTQWLVVTCTHVLQKLQPEPNSPVFLKHFNPEVGEFEAEIVRFEPPQNPPHDWEAAQDVAILRPVHSLAEYGLKPYPLHGGELHPEVYPCDDQSICFGYAQDRANRGDYIPGLRFAHVVAGGFVALTNSGGDGVRPGVSGAAWGNRDTQTIVGMVQSIAANGSRAYLIPTSTILRVINSLPR